MIDVAGGEDWMRRLLFVTDLELEFQDDTVDAALTACQLTTRQVQGNCPPPSPPFLSPVSRDYSSH